MKHRCASCGFQPENADFLRLQTGGLAGRRRFCPGCKPSRTPTGLGRVLVALAISVLLAFVGITVLKTGSGYVWIGIAALTPCALLTIVVHEFGHVAAGRLVGKELYDFVIGSGPPIWIFRLGGIRFEIRRNPFGGGHVFQFFRPDRASRWKQAIVLLGGVAGNAIVGSALFVLAAGMSDRLDLQPEGAGHSVALVWVTIVFAAAVSQWLAVLMNLWPRMVKVTGGRRPSDGKQLIGLFGKQPSSEAIGLLADVLERSKMLRARKFEEALAHSEAAWLRAGNGFSFAIMVHCTGKLAGPRAAVQLYFDNVERMPQTEDLDPEWSFALGNVAWHALMADEPEWLGVADHLSELALAGSSDGPLRATRGGALIAKGDVETGEKMMRDALADIQEAEDKAEFCDFLARHGSSPLRADYSRLAGHVRSRG